MYQVLFCVFYRYQFTEPPSQPRELGIITIITILQAKRGYVTSPKSHTWYVDLN